MIEQEKTLCEALSFAGIEELPKKADKNVDWKKGVALVTKATNRQSYVIVKKNEKGVSVIKDFGTICPIKSIDEVYPYEGVVVVAKPQPQTQSKGNKNASSKSKGKDGAKTEVKNEQSKEQK